ncbi:MAG: 5'-3' exonuclease, partial [Vicinamibacteria bacterium]
MANRPTLYLIDASSYIFRAFFAIRSLSNSKGFPTNAIFGVTGMLTRLLREGKPDYIAMVYDTPAPTFRDELYKEYKANREETPEDLVRQLPLVREVVQGFRIAEVELDGFEADDLIGSIAKRLEGRGIEIVIVTGDKDLMQLVRPGVALLDTMKDKWIREPEVREKFGVGPDKVAEVLGLAGDSTDNSPGVPGIGPKTAGELVAEFGSIENVLSKIDKVKGEKRRESLRMFADQAKLSRVLATIHCDAPIDFDFDQFAARMPDRKKLRELFRELEFHRFLEEMRESEDRPEEPPQEGRAAAAASQKFEAVFDAERLE